ncbi:NAD(P)H-binding protein [Kiritimatiellaeota bacterium B1221]|nr:NAD(P)H-binding protein [Kiritimatiellaeota bacterium B1221]
MTTPTPEKLIIGGNGKTGSRVLARLHAKGIPARNGSRSSTPAFDWNRAETWAPALHNVDAVYITYHPDLTMPAAPGHIQAFVETAVKAGVTHLVLLSGRGEAEARRCEKIVQASGVDWTIARCSFFNQNYSEAFLRDAVMQGTLALPVGDVLEPYVDAEDIADVVTAALSEPGHEGQIYELTGPRLLHMNDIAAEISRATGRPLVYQPIRFDQFREGLAQEGLPPDLVDLFVFLFREVMDGRNASVQDGVQRALGRAPRDFSEYARATALAGAWREEVYA